MSVLKTSDMVVPVKVQPGSALSDFLKFKAEALNTHRIPCWNSTVGQFKQL